MALLPLLWRMVCVVFGGVLTLLECFSSEKAWMGNGGKSEHHVRVLFLAAFRVGDMFSHSWTMKRTGKDRK